MRCLGAFTEVYVNGLSVEYCHDILENISEVRYNNNGTETKAYERHYTTYGQLARLDNLLTGKSISCKYDDDNRLIGFVEYDSDDAADTFSYTVFCDNLGKVESLIRVWKA